MNFTMTELEAATIFLRERHELWERHARDLGVSDPDNLPREFAQEHARQVREKIKKPRR